MDVATLAAAVIGMQQAETRFAVKAAVLKTEQRMQADLIAMIAASVDAARPPAPAGMGMRLDRSV